MHPPCVCQHHSSLVVFTPQEDRADKVPRALNLATDPNLYNSTDCGALLDLIDEYVDDCQGSYCTTRQPNPLVM